MLKRTANRKELQIEKEHTMSKIKDLLYTARWALTEAIDKDKFGMLATAVDRIADAQALIADDVQPAPDDEPPVLPIEEPIASSSFVNPHFEVVKGVKFKKWGYKNEFFDVLVTHYTVSGSSAKSAIGVLKSLAKRGLGCMVMDEDGIIYIPEGFNVLTDAAAHAGLSKWNGMTGLNSYAAGMEICNWGKLDSKTKKYAKKIRTSKGEANIYKGEYEAYTPKQEAALINFCLWAKSVNPNFKFENVCGHDEARALAGQPGGKSDPGASLSMTMPKFRELLKKS